MVTITEIKKKAKAMGISNSRLEKEELVHAIQESEGNFPCYKTANDFCDQVECCWREDCLSEK
ncbi:MAG: SAP domain-containing protein [Fibrobacter sp.]|nr:SAP domain-containing protein [Fibrobacter sp.]